MMFSLGKHHTSKMKSNKFARYLDFKLVLAWAIPCAIMLIIFIARGIFPFGDRSFVVSDMYHQYVPFFSEFYEAIHNGEKIAYSYHLGIGSNFLSLFGYYLASPFHLLGLVIPKKYMLEFLSYLIVVKIGLCGLTGTIYLRQHFRTKSYITILFSCFYALSGFIAAYSFNMMWLDCVILFPIILLGLEKLVIEKKGFMYCVALAMCIYTNFYISIMVCFFLVLYFVYLFFTEKKDLKGILRFMGFSLLAGGIASCILIPEILAIIETDFGNSNFPSELKSYFPIVDILARHSMNVTTEKGLEHWPNIYAGVWIFMLVPMYVLNPKISIKKRFGKMVLLGFFLFSFSTNILDFIWHGFNYPDSLPARQSFMYIFLIIVVSFEAFIHIGEMERKNILYGFLAAVGFILFCEKFIEYEDFPIGIEIVNIVFLSIYAVLLYYFSFLDNQMWKKLLLIISFFVVSTECTVNMINTSLGTIDREEYIGEIEDYQTLYQVAKQETKTFFRVEKFNRVTKNDGTLAGYPTASLFSSTMNSDVANLYKRLGMRYSKVFYSFDGATPLISALLNVNYMFGEIEDEEENELFHKIKEENQVVLYQNQYTLPFGYVAKSDFDLPENFQGASLKLQNEIVKKLGIKEDLFIKINSTQEHDNISLDVSNAGFYYGVITASGTKKVVSNNGVKEREFSDLKSGSVLYLGYLAEGEKVILSNNDENDETKTIKVNFYQLNLEVLEKALDILSETSLENVVVESTSISGELSLKEAGRLILSIPYEHGWTAYINDEKVELETFGGVLLAIDLEPGNYSVYLTYSPYGKNIGLFVSIGCLFILGGIFFVRRKNSRKRSK